jgi:hypothetical protein
VYDFSFGWADYALPALALHAIVHLHSGSYGVHLKREVDAPHGICVFNEHENEMKYSHSVLKFLASSLPP